MKLTAAVRKLERQAAKDEKLAKADAICGKLETIQSLVGILGTKATPKEGPQGP
jgi:hypothetical protein